MSNLEHPFLGKAWISLGILAFGDNWFGWRIPILIFSLLALASFYLLSRRFLSPRMSIYATSLLGFENIFFVHGSLALLDVPALFFCIFGFYLYERKRYSWSAASFALGVLSKETSLFFVLALVIYHLATAHRREIPGGLRKAIARGGYFVIILTVVVAVPITLYDVTYRPIAPATETQMATVTVSYDSKGGTTTVTSTTTRTTEETFVSNAFEHFMFISSYASALTITENMTVDAGNYAWNWVVSTFPPMIYYDEKVEKVVQTISTDGQLLEERNVTSRPISWFGAGTQPLWWSIWIVLGFIGYRIYRRRSKRIDLLILSLIAGTYLPNLYLSLVVSRIVYPFYFLNTVPALALGMALFFETLPIGRGKQFVLASYLLAVVTIFVYYFPVRLFDL